MNNTLNNEYSTNFSQESLPTSPDQLLKRLDALEIAYRLHHHEPIFTVAEGEHLKKSIPGLHCRNLFIRDKKETMFLVVAGNDTAVDMKKLQDLLGCGRLSFGSPDRLWQYLGIRPGSVCPFCILNDAGNKVSLILDQAMMRAEIVNYHPLDNAMTISLTPAALLDFFKAIGRDYKIMDLSEAAPA